MRTMYLPFVYESSGAVYPAMRTVKPTLAEAKAVLDGEDATLRWTDEFGGARAAAGGLVYEVVPVQVDVSTETPTDNEETP